MTATLLAKSAMRLPPLRGAPMLVSQVHKIIRWTFHARIDLSCELASITASTQVRTPARGLLQVILAQISLLSLLVKLTAGSAGTSAKLQLASLQIIPALTTCQVSLDGRTPEEPPHPLH